MHGTRPTQAVTSAPVSPKDDRHRRMRSYLLAMGFRTVSFPLAVFALLHGWLVVGWILAIAAIVLPSIAVTLANAVDHRRGNASGPVSPTRALPPR